MKALGRLLERFRDFMLAPLLKAPHNKAYLSSDAVEQKTLSCLYADIYSRNGTPISLRNTGFRVYSQHEEDGILLYLFSLIGTVNKRCVEICAGDGVECNTANLILNHRWLGLLCDGNAENIETARKFYSTHQDSRFWPPVILKRWITRSNINELISSNGFSGEIDLLSLDIDGVDYWIWKEIACISPRIVVLEFNHLWGPDASVTVPYRDDFVARFTSNGSDYAGASLAAFVSLGKTKGYRLVGTNAIATNAFFLRDDIQCKWLPEVSSASCFDHPRAQYGMKERWPNIKDEPWQEV